MKRSVDDHWFLVGVVFVPLLHDEISSLFQPQISSVGKSLTDVEPHSKESVFGIEPTIKLTDTMAFKEFLFWCEWHYFSFLGSLPS